MDTSAETELPLTTNDTGFSNLHTSPLAVHLVALSSAVPNRVRTLRTVSPGMVEILMCSATTLSFLQRFSKRTRAGVGWFGGGGGA